MKRYFGFSNGQYGCPIWFSEMFAVRSPRLSMVSAS
jgi:hypothetical protein